MKYASVCSGVEAASLAWMPLGWQAAWFSEIEPFPCAVLKERFPNVPNLGDMTKIKVENLDNGDQRFTGGDGTTCVIRGGVDLLVGGTPCQGFSVAGKQGGLRDERSVLCLAYCELLAAMRPRWFVWENVPGVFSTAGGADFREFIRAIDALGYSCAWRVLDAQYVRVDGYPRAVPQRRRRVFVIGHSSSDWRYPASVLFEPDSLFGNTPPRRVKGQGFTADTERCAGTASDVIRMRAGKPGGGKGALVSHETSIALAAAGNDQTLIQGYRSGQHGEFVEDEVTGTIKLNSQSTGNSSVTLAASFMGGQGAEAGGIGYRDEVAPTIKASPSGGNQVPDVITVHGAQTPINNSEHANTLGVANAGLENCVCVGGGQDER